MQSSVPCNLKHQMALKVGMSTLYKKVLIINNKGYKQVKLLREVVSDTGSQITSMKDIFHVG